MKIGKPRISQGVIREIKNLKKLAYSDEDCDVDKPEWISNIDESPYHVIQEVNPANKEEYKILKFNGAKIKKDFELVTRVKRLKDDESKIKVIEFNMEGKKYLGDVLDSIPFGILNKNRTGVGATTLEIEAKRNSIIVCPNKSLAYSKSKSKPDGLLQYVGSPIGDITSSTSPKDIENYIDEINQKIADGEDVYKKFLVVADSLPRVYEVIATKKKSIESYFFLVDEVDMIQSDATYRPKLEDVIDYYFKFPPSNRALVSATIKDFTHDQVQEEPMLIAKYNDKEERQTPYQVIHTNNPNLIVARYIQEKHGDGEKIVIAYNSITDINEIILLLPEELRSRCGVLCSEESKGKVKDYYVELVDGKLEKDITFMTCVYFVGVDINERFQLVSVVNADVPYTLLSLDRLTQIRGRCRHKEGVITETIYYSTKDSSKYKFGNLKMDEYRSRLLKKADKIMQLYSAMNNLIEEEEEMKDEFESLFKKVKPAIQSYATETMGSLEVSLTREDIDENYQISYFNIDALVEMFDLLNNLYYKKGKLEEECGVEIGDTIHFEFTEEQKRCRRIVQGDKKERKHELMEVAKEKILKLSNEDRLTKEEIEQLKREKGQKDIERYYDWVIDLYEYVEINELLSFLDSDPDLDPREYRNYKNGVIFKALEDTNPFKAGLLRRFPVSETYYSINDIKAFVNEIVEECLHRTVDSEYTLTRLFNSFFTTKKGRGYKVLNVGNDKYPNPIKRISTNETYRYFDIE